MANNRSFRVVSVFFIIMLVNIQAVFAASSNLFGAYKTYSAGSPHAVGIGDLNHDNRMDVALTNNAGELKVFLQNALGDLDPAVTYTSGIRPEALAIGDLNHDDWDDVVITNFSSNTISVFLQQADGTLAARTTYATGTGPDAVAVGDISGDGMDDIVVSNWNSAFISVFIQNSGGTLKSKVDYASPQAGYDDIAIGDINGDGFNDVVKMNGQLYANPDLSVYIQSGGTLQNAVSYSLTGNILGHGIGIGDVTGDGRADVVMSYGGNNPNSFIAVFAQSSDGLSLLAPVSYSAYDVPEALEVADVNEDGMEDVIVAHGGWDNISVYLQENGGALSNYSLYALPDHSASHFKPQGLEVGDVNGDALPDILVANLNFGLNLLPHVPPPDGIGPTVVSITRASANPTTASAVYFNVTFSESVTSVDASDFLLTKTGDITGESITNISGSYDSYTVTVNTGSGDGTLRLDLPDTASIQDLDGNPLGDLPFMSGQVYTVSKSEATFNDVSATHWAWIYVERLADAGITGGCGSGNYCPDNVVTRAQMAVFLLRGIHGSSYAPPAATGSVFNDVGAGDFAAAWIEQMVSEGITSGCGGGNYCPDGFVTRAQMAVFLLRAKYGPGYTPPAATGTDFMDVSLSTFAAPWIEQLAAEGVSAGCGGGNYCPNDLVTRAEMAVFLVRTFDLP